MKNMCPRASIEPQAIGRSKARLVGVGDGLVVGRGIEVSTGLERIHAANNMNNPSISRNLLSRQGFLVLMR